MNFVTKNLLCELKELLELKELMKKYVSKSDNIDLVIGFIESEIEQHMRDIMYTEKL